MILDSLSTFADSSPFMPHGHCYLWLKSLMRLHIASDAVIASAYYAIPLTIAYFMTKRPDLPYRWILLMYGALMAACGTTHLMEIVTLYVPLYWISGGIKALTAVLSVMMAVTLIFLIPKALRLRLLESREQLEHKVIERTAQLTASNKELESFCYSVSHDLRAPLRGIDGFSRIVLETQASHLDAAGVKYLERIRASAKRMGTLIDDLLTLSHLSRVEMVRETVNLSSFSEEIVQELRESDPARQARFIIPPNVTVLGDPILLRVVLENLLGNAWKFTSRKTEGTVIELGVQELEGQTVYFVKDNGAGFEMAYAQDLFGAFQRLHSVEEFPGNGIGLASVQRIVHRHGGRMWAEGKVGEGAAFYFTLQFPAQGGTA